MKKEFLIQKTNLKKYFFEYNKKLNLKNYKYEDENSGKGNKF